MTIDEMVGGLSQAIALALDPETGEPPAGSVLEFLIKGDDADLELREAKMVAIVMQMFDVDVDTAMAVCSKFGEVIGLIGDTLPDIDAL